MRLNDYLASLKKLL